VNPAGAGGGRFPTTRGSAVLGVRSPEPAERAQSLETLTAAYWKPVYKYIRVRRGCGPEEAEDLTQGFFLRAVEKKFFESYDPSKARFRTFLRTCLEGYLSNELRAERRLKRGGGVAPLSLDFAGAEAEIASAPASVESSPEDYFRAEWIRALFGQALESLRRECETRGKEIHFGIFTRYDLDEPAGPRPTYAELAAELGITPADVTNYLAFARREFRRILLERLREITVGEEEFQREARVLLGIRGE
jgi:RNA polymerase sigma factor (sigma-70 family)